MDFFEVAHTQRSIQRFKPDPVPDNAVGYPEGERFGPTTRKPVDSVTSWETWGTTRAR